MQRRAVEEAQAGFPIICWMVHADAHLQARERAAAYLNETALENKALAVCITSIGEKSVFCRVESSAGDIPTDRSAPLGPPRRRKTQRVDAKGIDQLQRRQKQRRG